MAYNSVRDEIVVPQFMTFAILTFAGGANGNVAPKRLFEDQLFGLSGEVGSNAVEVYVHRLRKMLGDAGASVRIHTVRGVGYLMAEEKAQA